MLALLDADIFSYRCAASAENDSAEVAIWRFRDSVEMCLAAVGATEYQMWFSDKSENNYRYLLYPEYKANRTQPPPKYLPDVREYAFNEWMGMIAFKQEADDALGIEQCRDPNRDTIICSIDKDLLQIPGKHFNFVKNEYQEVTLLEGTKHFYKQTLIGDRADNIFGVKGIGPVKASGYIDCLSSDLDMWNRCVELYCGEADRLLMNAKVLYIRKLENEDWSPPRDAEIQD